jgi:hypothetical protein
MILCASLWSSRALADGRAPDKAACLDAASQSQNLRDTHKLVEAREKLHICAQQACPAVVQEDCLTWLNAVEESLPTVVLTAKDGAGRDLVDVKVVADGQPLVSRLEGVALPMNPGPHVLHFETAGGVTLDQQVLVREGVKNQTVAVVLGTEAPATAGAAAPERTTAGSDPTAQLDTANASGHGSIRWRTVGLVTGGAGIVGLGIGTLFGFRAISEKNSAHCDASGACDAGPLKNANSAASLSTVGLLAGGVLLAGGAALVLFAPKGDSAAPVASASLRLAPLVGPRDAGLQLGGSW